MSKEVTKVGSPDNRTCIILVALFLIGVPSMAILVYVLLGQQVRTTANTGVAIIEGTPYDGSTVVDPPRVLQDFTLDSHTGAPLSLSDLRGQVVLMYFGYTHCPDYCPATLLNFQRVKAMLGDQADEVAFLFISVDPRRDTPDAIAQYLEERGAFVTGLAGDEAILQSIAPDYGLYINVPSEGEDGYLVDHSTSSYLVDPEGRLVTVYSYGTEPDVIAQDIRELLG